ncbi:hypothetical protein EGW08_013168 [Elysia chlorotica]|uniref:Endoplasmic reticulum junction formation protein lunapark n=1 Tax=Elysia chlorotica TaxID=188477 RepID=A0A3S0ZHK2_ELYCH|nr:hypothetical protein EGW08_013168 [Elysia chlorotica]
MADENGLEMTSRSKTRPIRAKRLSNEELYELLDRSDEELLSDCDTEDEYCPDSEKSEDSSCELDDIPVSSLEIPTDSRLEAHLANELIIFHFHPLVQSFNLIMGLLISRFRSKKSTIEILEGIDKDINRLQKNRKQNQERQKKIVTSLLIYSIAAYVLSAIIFFVYYFPDTWKLRFLYSLPLLIFPLLIWGLKKLLHWYFVKRIASNDGELLKLREQKKQILEDVMETETYKKAKEILEKFDPVRFRKLEALPEAGVSPSGSGGTAGTAIHQRSGSVRQVAPRAGLMQQQQRQLTARTPMSTPRMPAPQPRPMPAPTPVKTSTPYPGTPNLPPRYPGVQPSSAVPQLRQQGSAVQRQPSAQPQQIQQQQQQQQMGGTPMVQRGYAGSYAPGPPMPRTILPQQRGTMDRLMDYLVGDGPENRYALICQQCFSHNGMALKEEFEYLNSQGSAASDGASDDDEDDDSGEDEAEQGRPATRPDNQGVGDKPDSRGMGRQEAPTPGPDRGLLSDGDGKSLVKGPGAAAAAVPANRSSNALSRPGGVRNPSMPVKPGHQQQRQVPSQSPPGPQEQRKFLDVGAGDTGAVGKADATGKSGMVAKPKDLSKPFQVEAKTERERSTKTESSVVRSNTQEQKTEQTKTLASEVEADGFEVIDNDEARTSLETPTASSSTSAAEGDHPNIPFVDDIEELLSPISGLQLSEGQTHEDMSSFVSGITEEQIDTFSSMTSDTETRSSLSTSVAEQENADSPSDGGKESESGGSQPDQGQTMGLTLSEEIRDSVQSLLSPSAPEAAVVGEDMDEKTTHFSEETFLSVDGKPQDHIMTDSTVRPSE